jgi:hypothetical protein
MIIIHSESVGCWYPLSSGGDGPKKRLETIYSSEQCPRVSWLSPNPVES